MPQLKWRLKGKWIKNCNCDPGCPCDFWARPTHGACEGIVDERVEAQAGALGRADPPGSGYCARPMARFRSAMGTIRPWSGRC